MNRFRVFFGVCSLVAVAAALFHFAALLSPAINRIEYESTYPAWRHVLFIGIDLSLAVLFVRRPRWLVWPYAILTIQVLNGHGRGAWVLWVEHGQTDWISIAASLAAPLILLLLFIDRRWQGASPTRRR